MSGAAGGPLDTPRRPLSTALLWGRRCARPTYFNEQMPARFLMPIPKARLKHFYWDDIPARRLRPDMLERETLEKAKALARAASLGTAGHCAGYGAGPSLQAPTRWGRFSSKTKSPAFGRANRKHSERDETRTS
jgi:hypothetical protein